jgi:hypothetical protein
MMEPRIVVDETTHGAFSISTIVTRSYFETRVFNNSGDEIPEGIKLAIKNRDHWTSKDYDTVAVNQDRESVESYSHSDAEDIHFAMSAEVARFLTTHTRTVTYVPNK